MIMLAIRLNRREVLARVKLLYAIIAIILATLGALTLRFGECIGFDASVRGSIAGFIFALIPVIMYIGYDIAKSEREKEEKRRAIFMGVYLELLESIEYLSGIYRNDKSKDIFYIPPLTSVAWNTACVSGFIQPDNEFYYKLAHIYLVRNNFNYLMNQAIDVRVKSTLPESERVNLTYSLIELLRKIAKSLVPLLTEVKDELERELGISAEEVSEHQKDIKERIQKLRLPDSEKGKKRHK